MAKADKSLKTISLSAQTALSRRISISRSVLMLERVTQAFWGVAVVLLVLFALFRWEVLSALPPQAMVGLVSVLVVFAGYLVVTGLMAFRIPSRADAVLRLDRNLAGRPLSALDDDMALGQGDADSEYLWALHRERMAVQAEGARVDPPDLRLAKRDPWATRLLALLAVCSAVLFARGDAGQAMLESLLDRASGAAMAEGPSFEAWAEPPGYTGQPTIYMNDVDGDQAIPMPVGTQITVRLYGQAKQAEFIENVTEAGNTVIPAEETDVVQMTFEARNSGTISLDAGRGAARVWGVDIIADAAPTVELTDEVSRTIQGAMQVPFRATDDYGVIGGEMTATLDLGGVERRFGLALEPEPVEPLILDVPLPFTGDTTEFEETLIDNQAKHPWAGLPVTITLQVVDDASNIGGIEPLIVDLPGKRFFDPLAAAVVDIRRELLWTRDNKSRAIYLLKAVTYRPEDLRADEKAYLMLRTALRRLEYDTSTTLSDEAKLEITDLLWNAAVLIEDGDLGDAKERLKRAQERLSEAIENGATDDEIAELMQELRDATRDYMRQLAENAEESDSQQSSNQQGQNVTQDQIQQMMDEIQSLMEQGRMEEAQQLLEMLQEMLENMRITRQNGESGDQDQDNLQNSLREQQELADDTFRELQEQFERDRQQQQGQNGQQGQQQQDQNGAPQNEGQQQGQQGQQQGQSQQGQQQGQSQQGEQQGQGQQGQEQQRQGQGQGGNNQSFSDLAGRQEALRRMLSDQRGGMNDDGSEAGEAARRALEQAERSMRDAEERLGEGDAGGALNDQADAMDAMREGLRQMNEQQRQAQGEQQGGEGQGNQGNGPRGQRQSNSLDPLGREQGNGFSDQNHTNNRGLNARRADRARKVFEDIRERSNERQRPQQELEYLDRLLDRF